MTDEKIKAEIHRQKLCANLAIRREIWEGREQIVAPVIFLTEGVHNGSGGPLYYPAEELAKFPGAWNGIPIPVFHPIDGDLPVSANSPRIAERCIGRLWNVVYEDGKLKGELWLDRVKTQELSPEILGYLTSGRQLEVSTGLFTEDEEVSGTWNGEEYHAIARNYRPDHLALLPGSRGACSWADGCGVRANGECCMEKKTEEVEDLRSRGMWKRLIAFMNNEASFEDTQRALQSALDALDSPTAIHFLKKVYDNHFIYMVRPGEEMANGEPKLYQRSYTMAESGINLGDDPVEVREETNYIEVRNDEPATTNGGNIMAECKQKVNELISNGAFEEADREMLEKMDCAAVTRLGERFQALSAKPVEKKEDPPKPKENEERPKGDGRKITLEDLPEEMQELLRSNQAEYERNRAELAAKIMKFRGNKFSEEDLKAMSVPDLRNIFDLVSANVTPELDYSLMGGTFNEGEGDEEEPLEAPTMNWDKK